jgi:uncharacterized protein
MELVRPFRRLKDEQLFCPIYDLASLCQPQAWDWGKAGGFNEAFTYFSHRPDAGHDAELFVVGQPFAGRVSISWLEPRGGYNLRMYVADLIWLPHIVDKLEWKHHVAPTEVEQVVFGQSLFRTAQKGHVPGEDVYAALGQTEAGRYLVVFFVYKQTREALILSARDMDEQERRQYERR